MENWEYRKMRGTDKPCTGKIYTKVLDLRRKPRQHIFVTDTPIKGGGVKKEHKSLYDIRMCRTDEF